MDIQSITKSISTMEAQLGELRKIVTMMGGQAAPVVTEKVKKERKPRSADAKPNAWIEFTKTVRAALVAGGEAESAGHRDECAKHRTYGAVGGGRGRLRLSSKAL